MTSGWKSVGKVGKALTDSAHTHVDTGHFISVFFLERTKMCRTDKRRPETY